MDTTNHSIFKPLKKTNINKSISKSILYDDQPLFKQDHTKYYNGQSCSISEEAIKRCKIRIAALAKEY